MYSSRRMINCGINTRAGSSRPLNFLAFATMKLLRIFATFALSAAGLYFSPAAANAASPVVPLAIPGLKKIDYKADPVMTEYAKQAGSQAVGEWMTDFIGKKFAAKRYVLLPLAGDVDDGYFTLLAR